MIVKVKVEKKIGDQILSMETGQLAKLAAAAVVIQYGETSVLCSAAVSYTHLTLPTKRIV